MFHRALSLWYRFRCFTLIAKMHYGEEKRFSRPTSGFKKYCTLHTIHFMELSVLNEEVEEEKRSRRK